MRPRSDTVFGKVVLPLDLEKAITGTLELWMPTYLRFMERHLEYPVKSLPEIASYRSADTANDRFPEQQIPAVQVMMTTDVDLTTLGTSAVAQFKGTVDVLIAGPTPEDARETASVYAFAMGLLISQQDGLVPVEGLDPLPISGIGWEKVSVPAVGGPDGRWLALGSIDLEIAIEGVFNKLLGPEKPTLEPPEEYIEVTETDLKLEAEVPE